LAVERGWAINLGGGFHHCCANRGGGFCAYADISLAVRLLLDWMPELENVMIIDLDASQVLIHKLSTLTVFTFLIHVNLPG
jgi:histone deacetylase 11